MAQAVKVTIEFERGDAVALPGSINREEDGQHETSATLHAHYQSDAVINVLMRMKEAGLMLDGPLVITTEKMHQVGGDDGAMFVALGGQELRT